MPPSLATSKSFPDTSNFRLTLFTSPLRVRDMLRAMVEVDYVEYNQKVHTLQSCALQTVATWVSVFKRCPTPNVLFGRVIFRPPCLFHSAPQSKEKKKKKKKLLFPYPLHHESAWLCGGISRGSFIFTWLIPYMVKMNCEMLRGPSGYATVLCQLNSLKMLALIHLYGGLWL